MGGEDVLAVVGVFVLILLTVVIFVVKLVALWHIFAILTKIFWGWQLEFIALPFSDIERLVVWAIIYLLLRRARVEVVESGRG